MFLLLDLFNPSLALGATSEKFAEKVEDYIKTNKNHRLKVKGDVNNRDHIQTLMTGDQFRAIMSLKYLRSLVEPGEAVGLLASQG